MSRGIVPLVMIAAVLGCSRPNPLFIESTESSSEATAGGSSRGDGSAVSTSATTVGVSDSVDDDAGSMSTSDPSAGDSRGETVGVSATDGDSETGGPPCVAAQQVEVADRDTFMVAGQCDGTPCQVLNFGGSFAGVIEDVYPEFRGYMLMSFDLSGYQWVDPETGVILELWVESQMDMYEIGATAVFPVDWVEGEGIGMSPAKLGWSAWEWPANPDPWINQDGIMLPDFGDVVLDGDWLNSETFAQTDGPELLLLAVDDVFSKADPRGIVHLAVTLTDFDDVATEPPPTVVFTDESGWAPALTFSGC